MKKSIGKACKHAYLSRHKNIPDHDLLTAKITEYFDDGSEESKLVRIENFKRDFYIVKDKYRDFKDKRQYIPLNKVKKFKSNESRLAYNISKLLGRADRNAKLNEVKNSPFVFGCQESAAVIFKQHFYDKYSDVQNKAYYSFAAYDVETYITEDGFGTINMASITMGGKVFWCGLREFFPDKDDETIIRKLKEAAEQYLDPDYIKKHNVNIKWELADTSAQIVIRNVHHFHEYSPDLIGSWNANFDMQRNQEALYSEGYDPKMIYSDPSIPDHYKDYSYFEGRKEKTKVTGVKTALDDQERFPVLRAPASWQWFDAMSFYALSRIAAGKKESYSLQYTANEEGISGKLYTEHGKHLTEGSVDWHRYMQKHHPYVYAIYNIQDNFVIEDLNRKTQDYSLALPSLISSSELPSYQSQPQMISDKLSFIALKHGYVWGTVGSMKSDKFKDIKPDLGDWIALLHTEMCEDNGQPLYEGLDSVRSRGHQGVSDIDITASYPSATVAMNVSNYTTMFEVCQIEGLDRIDFRRFGVNYASSVPANATVLANTVYGIPDNIDMKKFYLNTVMPFIESKK